MRKNPFILIFIGFLMTFPVLADDSSASVPNEEPPAEAQLSAAGIRRLEENKQILSKSVQTAKTNIENCQSNAATLGKQLEEVSKIETELTKLKEQYETFLRKAEEESQKNREALTKLLKSKDRKLSAIEKTDREAWAKDTSEKATKVKGLLQKLKKEVEAVQFQKKDLLAQRNHWLEREKVHQKMLEELNAKQEQTDKKLKGDS
ncbi:MAG: hypothetical protein EBQ92_04715 [Proteobacteria bacterium]|nr:hypothetical protein [Pseudomonadota bacterium]